jgi:hypothetical protein
VPGPVILLKSEPVFAEVLDLCNPNCGHYAPPTRDTVASGSSEVNQRNSRLILPWSSPGLALFGVRRRPFWQIPDLRDL